MFFALKPIIFLGVLLVPALLITLIVLLVKGSPAARWTLGLVFLLLVVGFFGMFNFSKRVVVHEAATPAVTAIEPLSQSSTIQIIKDPVVWSEGMEEELTPAVYSSLQKAAYGLGVKLQDTVSTLPQLPDQIVLTEFTLSQLPGLIAQTEPGGNVDIVVLDQLRRGLQFVYPDIPVVIAEQASGDNSLRISLNVKDIQKHSATLHETHNINAEDLSTGTKAALQAILQTADNKYVQQVSYDYRPWLYNSQAFQASVSRGNWVVMASDQTAVTQQQATDQLMQAATDFLSEQIATASPLQAQIQPCDLQHYGFIADEYYQQLQGLSGPIWRGALLLEVSPQRLQLLAQDKTVVVRQVRKAWIWRIFSLLVMILLISILYAVVNAITKGYYSVMSAVLAIGLVAIFVLFLFLA